MGHEKAMSEKCAAAVLEGKLKRRQVTLAKLPKGDFFTSECTDTHVQKAVKQLRVLKENQRPACVEKLASFVHRRGCCTTRLEVPAWEVAAGMLPWMDCFTQAESLQRLLEPFAAISTDSEIELVSTAAARAARALLRFDLTTITARALGEFVLSQAWVDRVVEPAVLAAELSRRGIVAEAAHGRLIYNEAMIEALMIAHDAVPAQLSVKPSRVQTHIHLGGGELACIRARRLRQDGLFHLQRQWERDAFYASGNFLAGDGESTIEASQGGLALVISSQVVGARVNAFQSALKQIAYADIKQHDPPTALVRASPHESLFASLRCLERGLRCQISVDRAGGLLTALPRAGSAYSVAALAELLEVLTTTVFKCCTVPAADVGMLIGKRGLALRGIEARCEVLLSVEQPDSEGMAVIIGRLHPCLVSGSPGADIERLRSSVETAPRHVERAIKQQFEKKRKKRRSKSTVYRSRARAQARARAN